MTPPKLLQCLILTFLVCSATLARAEEPRWNAQWIWANDAAPTNAWVAFRSTFEIGEVPEEAIASIAVDTKHWLWVNGELVRFDGGRAGAPSMARPWTRSKPVHEQPASEKPRDTWYEEIDLTSHLVEGKNTIAVLVWHWGRETHKGYHIDSGQGGLFFELPLPGDRVLSSSNWKAFSHPGYDPHAGELDRSIVGFDLGFNANHAMGDWTPTGWHTPGFDDADWPAAVEHGTPPTAPWHTLVLDDVPPLQDHGLQPYPSHPETMFPFVSDGTEIRARLPFNQQVTPFLTVESAEGGEEIVITTDNRLNRIDAFYTTRPGVQSFEAHSWMSGHEIVYQIPEGVRVHALKHRRQSVGKIEGALSISDPDLQRLWDMGANTLMVCARDNFMDCPDRERALWIGDVADQASYLFYVMGSDGRALLKRAIESTFAFSEDGAYGALGPLRIRELPSQSLQFVFQGVWEHYLNTGDREVLELSLPAIFEYLAKWDMADSGLPAYSRGFSPDRWDWVDWGKKETHDKPVIQAALYYAALDGAVKIAETLGDTDRAAWARDRMTSIEGAFDEQFWAGDHYSSAPGELADDRANALAILSGLAGPERFEPVVRNVLIPNRFCSPHFEWMVNLAMSEAGFTEEAVERMVERYRPQIDRASLTTLHENFPAGGSYNHAWNAPNAVIARRLVGIRPVEPGWKHFRVTPELLHVDSLSQSFPTVAGDVTVGWNRVADHVAFHLEVPEGATARFDVPRGALVQTAHQLSVNEKAIWPASDAEAGGATLIEATEGRVSVELPAGRWELLLR